MSDCRRIGPCQFCGTYGEDKTCSSCNPKGYKRARLKQIADLKREFRKTFKAASGTKQRSKP